MPVCTTALDWCEHELAYHLPSSSAMVSMLILAPLVLLILTVLRLWPPPSLPGGPWGGVQVLVSSIVFIGTFFSTAGHAGNMYSTARIS